MYYSNNAYSLFKTNQGALDGGGGGFADTQSLLYDGVDDFQEGTSWSTIDASPEFTISMWVKVNSLATTQQIITGYGSGTSEQLYWRLYTNGQMQCFSGGSGSNWSRTNVGAITIGVWYHVVIRLLDSSVGRYDRQRIFINGVVNHGGTNYYGGTIPNGTAWGVGANWNYSHPAYLYPTSGNINEVAIWGSNALTDAQILEVYNSGSANDLKTLPTAPSPTNWYRSENASWLGGAYYETSDEMGNGSKLTTRNMVEASRVNDVPPTFNVYSTTFDGVDDSVDIGAASLGITTAISVSAWVKIPTTNTGGGGTNIQVIMAEDTTSSGERNWNLFWRGGGIDSFYFVIHNTNLSSASAQSVGVTPNSGQWINILATYDGTANANGIKLYIDGVLNAQGTASSTGINSFTSSEPNIGRITGQNQWNFQGNIDEVAIWSNDQSSNVTTIYNSGVPNDISALSPLGWWRMGDGSTYPTINDEIGSNNGTMNNMSAANFVTDVPT